MSQLQTISEIQSEINHLENLVLYYQNRILRKKIAIQEMLETIWDSVSESKPDPDQRPTASQMVLEVLPAMNGDVFRCSDLRTAILDKYPWSKSKLSGGLYQAVDAAIRKGLIAKTPGGFKRVLAPC